MNIRYLYYNGPLNGAMTSLPLLSATDNGA